MPLTIVIASFLEPHLVDRIRDCVPEARVLYDPELIAPPRYAADHTGEPTFKRTPTEEARFRGWLAEAEILYDMDRTLAHDLPYLAPKLRWIQTTSSGIGKLLESSGLDKTDLLITNAAGIHAIPLAEHCLLSMLYFTKEVPLYLERQKHSHWERRCGRELRGQTVGIVGLGAVGQEIARLAKAIGLYVIGVKRTPTEHPNNYFADEVHTQRDLHRVLPKCHHLVLICPHTAETEGIIGATEIGLLPSGAVLINIGRGALVNESALLESLKSGHLLGAALDVAATEPLPADSPLWNLPNVLITSHSASTVEQENARLVELFCDNLKRYRANQPLHNLFQGSYPIGQ